ncbi:MAG: carboxypeptidase-like regulatory domain-containing protein [Bacteroidales bacterium]
MTGIIFDESDRPVSNAGVISTKLRRGSLSDRSGIYSIISMPGDTLLYRALGFKISMMTVPRSFEGRHLSIDVVLYGDTIKIDDVVILPWRSYEEFKREITEPRPVDPEIANMNENLASIYSSIANSQGVTVSPEAGFRYAMEQNFSALATKNQYPVNNLLNPFAWAKFLSGVKNGLLRNQKSDSPVNNVAKPKKKKSGED